MSSRPAMSTGEIEAGHHIFFYHSSLQFENVWKRNCFVFAFNELLFSVSVYDLQFCGQILNLPIILHVSMFQW